MTEQQTERPLAELVRELAQARLAAAVWKTWHKSAEALWEQAHAEQLTAEKAANLSVANLEAAIRTRGAELARFSGWTPPAGTKARHERVLRYVCLDGKTGEIANLDEAIVNQSLVNYAVEHEYYSYLKPDRAKIEKALKALDESARPPWVREEWQTVVSIDSDLTPLLAKDNETPAG